ncbi:MAG TPA: murein biosynthesis integral membrane protein MurJ [Clostridia bacterium]|nr:murein biosynthesis integral membrane protein MurJ [Clostridia bacterium]
MKKTALIIMVLTIASKLIGFLRELTLSYFYGASDISDAYLIALTIPSVIFSFIGTGLVTSYIPLYSSIEQEKGIQSAVRFTNNLINCIFLICTVFIFWGLVFTEFLVKMFALGFTGETLKLAVLFTRIMLFGIFFTGVVHIFTGFLQIKNNYIIPALVGFPFNLIIIFFIVISSKGNLVTLAIGSVLATFSQLLLLIPYIRREGFRYNFILDRSDEYLRKLVYLSLPIMIGVSINQINVLVDRTLASQIVEGGISALNYANRLNLFVQGLFVLSIATVMYPMISKKVAEKNIVGLKKVLSESISGINLLVIPATVGAMIFAEPIVRLLFGRGAFDEQAVSLTSIALFFYSIGMVGYGLREILSRAFYSLQDTKTPMINATIAVVLNIILNIILSRFMGIGGLALATSISALFCTFLLFISLRKKIGRFGLKDMSISSVKIIIASIIMGFVAKTANGALLNSIGENLALLGSIGIGAVFYFGLIYFMRIKEVEEIIFQIKKEIRRVIAEH